MVEPESFDISDPNLKFKVNNFRASMPYRKANGKWNLTVVIGIEIELGDGRKLIVDEQVLLRPKQIGRKPNPKAFAKTEVR